MNIRRSILQASSTAVLFLFPVVAPSARADSEAPGSGIAEGVIVQSAGGLMTKDPSCAASGCVGDIVECEPGEVMTRIQSTFSFLEGVCDDASSRPCAGRVRALGEVCTNPTFPNGPDVHLSGSILSTAARGMSRVCFDPGGTSDCTNPLPAGARVVAESTVRAQTRQLLVPTNAEGDLLPLPVHNTLETSTVRVRPFLIDGRIAVLPGQIIICHATSQPDVDEDNCAAANARLGVGPGCGFASTGIKLPSSRKKPKFHR